MKKFSAIIVFSLLGGCAPAGHESSLLGGVLFLGLLILTGFILAPFFKGLDKVNTLKNKTERNIFTIIIVIGIIIVLLNLDKIFVVIGRGVGLGN